MSDSPVRTPTQSAIWDAALRLFSENGYAATSVRDIGAAAGVDPSLVIRHFGSKEQLFLDTMQLDLAANPLTTAPLETLGESFINLVLTTDEHVRGVFIALLRASGSDGISSQLREAHEQSFVAPLRDRMTGPDADIRARLAAALVGGLLYAVWVAGDEQLLAADHDDVVRRYGALLQSLITP